ncbi:hypothetical protein TELCIR_21395, partial [Teladorsagia circumcincta]
MYLNSSCCVRTNDGYTRFFEITTRVRQACILSPLLFNICLDFIMRKAVGQTRTGISWDDQERHKDLDFAGDNALIEEKANKLQEATTKLSNEADLIGLRIGAKKSKVTSIGSYNTQMVTNVDAKQLETVNRSAYLGSTVVCDGDAETDAHAAIPIYCDSHGAIRKRNTKNLCWPHQDINAFHKRCLRRYGIRITSPNRKFYAAQ